MTIQSKVPNKEFYEGWDRVFGQQNNHDLHMSYDEACPLCMEEISTYDENDLSTTYKEDQHH